MKKKKKNNKVSLEVLKYQALKARMAYQLPYKLVYYINQLSSDSPVDYVKYLSKLTEHYLRIKNYYKVYQDIEKTYNRDIENLVSEFLFKK